MDSIILQVAEEGPLRYLVDAKWNSQKAIHSTMTTPIIVMREEDREVLERLE
jgi:hypothetical protein